jgi:hypothetical protein
MMMMMMPNTDMVIQSKIKWAELVEHVREQKTAHSVSMRKPEWNNSLAGARLRWKDDIEMDFREIEREGVDWLYHV